MRLWFLYTQWCLIFTLFSEILELAKYFSVIDLKNAFFSRRDEGHRHQEN